jgi:hypothetical protein
MRIYSILFLSSGLLASTQLEGYAEGVTAEDKALIEKLCKKDAECEQQQLKQYAEFQATATRKRNAPPSTPRQTSPATDSSIATVGKQPGSSPQKDEAGCTIPDQRLFIRSDSLDNFNYLKSVPLANDPSSGVASQSSAVGASLSYTDNRLTAAQMAAINARISYLLFGKQNCPAPTIKRLNVRTGKEEPGENAALPYLYGWGFAPFVSTDGTWNNPFTSTTTTTKATSAKSANGTTTTTTRTSNSTTTTVTTTSNGTVTTTTKKTSSSAVRVGADFQLAYATRSFLLQENYFYASPFYQTDFAGLAQIGGLDVSWQPASYPLHLGVASTDPWYTFIWQFKGETELTQVSNPGYTLYTSGQHALFGEQVRANLALFPLNSGFSPGPWYDAWVAGRISLIGTQQYYWDVASKQAAPYYSFILQYKLGQCVNDSKTPVGSACAIAGSSALSFEYDTGRDKDTLVKTKQFLVKLSFAY